MLIAASIVVNLMNFAFNAVLGRVLSFSDFGLLTLFNTFVYLLGVAILALGTTVNQRTAFLNAKFGPKISGWFLHSLNKKTFRTTVFLSLSWIAATPFLVKFFQVPNAALMLLFTPAIVLGALASTNKGYLQGSFLFAWVAAAMVIESAAKFFTALGFVALHLNGFVALSLPISITVSYLFTAWLAGLIKGKSGSEEHQSREALKFPRRFFVASVLTGISAAAFLSLDLILAKHYLPADLGGQYAMLSLVGKIIYFVGTLVSSFIVTFVSDDQGRNKDSDKTFNYLFTATAFLTICAFVVLGPLGSFSVPVLFGAKSHAILPFLNIYALAVTVFTLANAFVVYHVAKKNYYFSVVAVSLSALMCTGIYFYHSGIAQITRVLLNVSILGFFIIAAMHILEKSGIFILRNVVDFIDLFFPLPKHPESQNGGKKILIFNWRDTSHKFAGGAEVYINELAKIWVERGNSVTLFCGNDGLCPRNEYVDGVQIVRRGGFYLVYFWAFLYYLAKFRGRYDIIIDSQNGIPFFTPLYAKERVYCVVHHVHQEIFRKYLSWPLAAFAALLEKRLMRSVYKHTQFITVSESTKKEMLQLGLGESGIEVVYNGVDLKKYYRAGKSSTPLIIYLGRLKAYKRVDVLIRAFSEVNARVPEARLTIAGSGEEQESLQKLAGELRLKNVWFLGKVSEADKISLLQKCWVMVHPSLIEGWGITTIEANACGTPVVASDVSGLRDSVKNLQTGFLVEHGNPSAFSAKILEILNDSALRQRLSEKSVEWARQFDWHKSSDYFLSLMDRYNTKTYVTNGRAAVLAGKTEVKNVLD